MNSLDGALYSTLSGGTALTSLIGGTASPRIYHLQAPEGAALPYLVFNIQGGGDENMTANRTKNLVVFVRGYSGVTPAQAGSIDAQVDALLHYQSLNVSGWTNFHLAREQDLELVENVPSGGQIFMSGGMYRVRLDKN